MLLSPKILIFEVVVSKGRMTIPNANYVIDQQGQKMFVQLSVQEWENFVREFRRMENLLNFKAKLKEALLEVREIASGEKQGQTLSEFLDEL